MPFEAVWLFITVFEEQNVQVIWMLTLSAS